MKSTRSILSVLALVIVGAIGGRALATPPPVVPLAGIAYQEGQADPLADSYAFLAFASTAGPSHVERVAFIPLDRLAANDVDCRTLYIFDADASGNANGGPLFTGTTSTTAFAGSGDWHAGAPAFSVVLSYDLPAGHELVAVWESTGAGVSLPSGAWRVE